MSISALSECGSGPEPEAFVGGGPGGGWALNEAGSGAVHPSRPSPSVTGCHRNSICPCGLGCWLLGGVTKTSRSSVLVDQFHPLIALSTFPLQYGTPLKASLMGSCAFSMLTVWSYGVVKYHVSSSGVLCSHSQLPAGTATSGSILECGPACGAAAGLGVVGAAVRVAGGFACGAGLVVVVVCPHAANATAAAAMKVAWGSIVPTRTYSSFIRLAALHAVPYVKCV